MRQERADRRLSRSTNVSMTRGRRASLDLSIFVQESFPSIGQDLLLKARGKGQCHISKGSSRLVVRLRTIDG